MPDVWCAPAPKLYKRRPAAQAAVVVRVAQRRLDEVTLLVFVVLVEDTQGSPALYLVAVDIELQPHDLRRAKRHGCAAHDEREATAAGSRSTRGDGKSRGTGLHREVGNRGQLEVHRV